MSELPTVDDLFGLGQFWDGDKLQLNGEMYWRFMIFKYPDKHTYVLENRLKDDGTFESIVKRLM